jgi:hypothetical protein
MRLPWGLRWWELAPELAVGLGLGVFLATEPDAATSALSSTKAIVLMVTVGVGWLLARLVLVRWSPWPVLRLLVFGAAAIGVLVVVVVPAYDDETVVEALPTEVTTPGPTVPAIGDPVGDPPPTTAAPSPQPIASAPLEGIDHRASGTVTVYRQPSGRLVIGLEGIDIQPGPDYDVYVVAGADRQDVDGGLRLDDLRGNLGTQYYDVPDGAEVAPGAWTVLVWCQTFAVPVAGATPI